MPFPIVRLSNRPLHFIYLCDCSGSMAAQGKMQALNQAIRQSLPGMNRVARDNPEARVLVRAVSFAVVYWDGSPARRDPDFAGYLGERWALEAPDLTPEPDLWFRGEGHYARFSAPALSSSAG